VEFDLEVTIDRPVAAVFAYVTDVRNVPEWQESAEFAEWTEQGRRFRERRHFMGRAAELELEVTALEPERRFDIRTLNSPVTFEIRHSFAAVEGGRGSASTVRRSSAARCAWRGAWRSGRPSGSSAATSTGSSRDWRGETRKAPLTDLPASPIE